MLPPRSARLAPLALSLLLAVGAAAPEAPPPPESAFLLDAPGLSVLGPEALEEAPAQFPFAIGERLEYDVSWWGIAVGRASLEVARLVEWRGNRLAHVVATARTNDFFSLLYPVNDRSESWIDIDRMRTLRTATLTRHAKKETWEEVEFDWTTHLVHVVEEKRHVGRVKTAILDTGPYLYDTFDAFYALRTLPLQIGESSDLPVYASRKIYGLHVEVERREDIDDPVLGQIGAWVLRPSDSLDGEAQDDGAGEVLVSADAPHVPIRLRGWFRTVSERMRVGGVKVVLAGYRGAAPGWPAPIFSTAPARPWPARTKLGAPVWDVPPAVEAARAASGEKPGKQRIEGVLAPLEGCDDQPSRGWARVAMASPGCPGN
ncbi:MAG: DUF3108 domain-containing protein [Deltaproteobacteria bacterium]|nr:DUF3108 domain-containing protein [Deltaproteobacteria bacterium]MBW2393813.1 DUF3108 domain-containing protein [Deltaproteobacteria bacterium]